MKKGVFFYYGYDVNKGDHLFSFSALSGYEFCFCDMRFYVTNREPFIYNGGKGKISGWVVTHYDTGAMVTTGATRKEAMVNVTPELVEKINKVILSTQNSDVIDLMHKAYKIREGKLKEGEDIYQIYLKDIRDGKYDKYL